MGLIGVLLALGVFGVCGNRGAAIQENVSERFEVALFAHRLILAVPLVLPVNVIHFDLQIISGQRVR